MLSVAFTDRRENGRVLPDLRVTRHASVSGRHAGRGGCLNRGVAISAV
jgi:hypothetical protein